jgi:hypothetical protein
VAFANTCTYTTADSTIFAQAVKAATMYLANVAENFFQVGGNSFTVTIFILLSEQIVDVEEVVQFPIP